MSGYKGTVYAELVVFCAPVGTKEFVPVHRNNLPDEIIHPRVMAMMADGNECEFAGVVYRAADRQNMALVNAH